MGNVIYQTCIFCLLFIAIFLLSPFILKGQSEVLHFHRLSADQNLSSQTYNYYVFKDSEGFVWISTLDGLNRFDGKEVKEYHPRNDNLAGPNVQSRFFEDRNGDLWFSTVEALHRYDRKNERFFQYFVKQKDTLVQGDYQLLHLDTIKKDLWVRIEDSLFIYTVRQLKDTSFFISSIPNTIFNQIYNTTGTLGFDKYLFTPTLNGLQIQGFAKDENSWKVKNLEPQLRGYSINTVFYVSDEEVWVGANAGLFRLNLVSDQANLFRDFYGSALTIIIGIAPFENDTLIVATEENGIYYFDKSDGRFFKQLYSIEEEKTAPFLHKIDKIYLDQDNTLWLSCRGRGIYYVNLNKNKFATFLQNPHGGPSKINNVRSLTEDAERRIWCLTWGGIVVIDSAGQIIDHEPKYRGQGIVLGNNKDPSYIHFEKRTGCIWVCTQDALYVLKPEAKQFEKIRIEHNIRSPWFLFTKEFKQQDFKLLVSVSKLGLLEIKELDGKITCLPLPGMEEEYAWTFETKEGQLLLCQNEDSILIVRKENGQFVTDTSFVQNAMVNGILEDTIKKVIWIATANGLFKLTKQENRFSYQQDTLFNYSTLNGILQDNKGYLWISTNRGLVRYLPEKAEIREFGLADGLQSLEFNFWSAMKTSKGHLAFGGVNGVNIFDPDKIKDITTKANPTITSILINDKPPGRKLACALTDALNIAEMKKLVFDYSENTLTLRFAALEYSDPKANQFEYQLLGVDDDWVRSGTENFARYPNLWEGDYTFKVRATNSDGVWSEKEAVLQITVKPPFYRTTLAYILYIITAIGLIYSYYRFRITQIRKEAEFRQKEAEYKQLVAETETAVLRLQMNPHFIFNSMNSINSYILKKDIDTASDYLHRFATLMRMILKFAAKPLIAVSDEIELLQLYLQTEAMRFDKKFTYDFELKDDLDPDEFMIPTMILQPFVENAIWHGISGKQNGEGHIKIKFWQENESLFVSVEDNGAGRAASRETSQKAKTHESKALSITEHRLQLLEKKNGVAASFEIQDLLDEAHNPAGTKVVLRFPML